jgi:hypothetical protein
VKNDERTVKWSVQSKRKKECTIEQQLETSTTWEEDHREQEREREGERLTHVQMVIGEVSERERAYDEGLVVEGLVVAATQQARVRSADRTHASVLGKTEAMTRNNGIAKVSIKNNWPAPRGVPACRSR